MHWISFGLPTRKWPTNVKSWRDRSILISPLIPGRKDTYIYETESDYNAMLGDSCFAYTWKKGGWDCFRHVEIIAHGCIPLVPTIDKFPHNSLHLHDKTLYSEIWNECKDFIRKPDKLRHVLELHGDDWQRRLRARALTSDFVFKYILSKFKPVKRLFWIDHRLNQMFDYMSAIVFIGAMESGLELHVCSKSPDVLFGLTATGAKLGHGQGFNYFGYFSDRKAPPIVTIPIESLTDQDLVIFGSFMRSNEGYHRIAKTKAQIACIVGEDTFIKVAPAVHHRSQVFMREPTIHDIEMSAKFIPLEHLRKRSNCSWIYWSILAILVVIVIVLCVKR